MPRYPQLDFLRGVAILGILLLNIVSFALPSAAYLNPAWQGTPSLADTLDWAVIDLFGELKFLTLFALLFGAGLVFQLPRGIHWITIRLGWLVVFGLLHGILLWEGDILLAWGLCGLVACRLIANNSDDNALIRSGMVFYLFGLGLLAGYALISGDQPNSDWLPQPVDVMAEQQMKLHGGWLQVSSRISQLDDRFLALFTQYGWELVGLMMIGAGLTRNGWLLGQRSASHYWYCARRLLPIGLLITATGTYLQYHTGWAFRWSGFWLQLPREIGSPFISLGYIALLHACWTTLCGWRVSQALIKVGRMAFSNYILQTLVCTLLFSWCGYFLHFSRWQLSFLVPIIWLCNVFFSLCWLSYFRQGPLEWVWRRLTQLGVRF